MNSPNILAVIPARGGSKRLLRKNVRPLAGMPLVAHAIELAKRCPEITRAVVSTDSSQIAEIARAAGGEAPFLRPAELAQDDTPTLPVLQHGVRWHEELAGRPLDLVLLLQPTGPLRLPEDIRNAVAAVAADRSAVGVIGVSEMPHRPREVYVEQDGRGYLRRPFHESGKGVQSHPPHP